MLSLMISCLLPTWGKEQGREWERMKLGENLWHKMELIKEGSLEEISFKGEGIQPLRPSSQVQIGWDKEKLKGVGLWFSPEQHCLEVNK